MVDDLTRVNKFRNIVDHQINGYLDKIDLVKCLACGELDKARTIFHEGTYSDTMKTDGRYMMDDNYRYSLAVMRARLDQGMQFLCASSVVAYGVSEAFREEPHSEWPLNVYGHPKLLFDQIARRIMPTVPPQTVGSCYPNVYGPCEQHEGRMVLVAFHNFNQSHTESIAKLFGEYSGYP